MKKIIALVILLAFGALLFIASKDFEASVAIEPQANMNDFRELGYITQNGFSYISDNLEIIYEEPGAPALKAKLIFDEASMCRFGDQEVACLALSSPLIDKTKDKRVFVEGVKEGDSVRVRNFAPDTY